VPAAPAAAKLRENRSICRNAIRAPACLGGGAIDVEKRTKALQALEESVFARFVIVLRDRNNLKFRGIYGMAQEATEVLVKVFGAGPKRIQAEMAAEYFRSDSGAKVVRRVAPAANSPPPHPTLAD
jgi:hypothetical protein